MVYFCKFTNIQITNFGICYIYYYLILMKEVYLLLGSNLGNSKKYIADAVKEIEIELGLISKRSHLYETASWGKEELPNFINQIVIIRYDGHPKKLLDKIIVIEKKLGRERNEKWGSRTIDIDILFYQDLIIKEPDLIIPHPELQNRRFTLMPLMELAPGFIHPVFKVTISELFENLKDTLYVKKLINNV